MKKKDRQICIVLIGNGTGAFHSTFLLYYECVEMSKIWFVCHRSLDSKSCLILQVSLSSTIDIESTVTFWRIYFEKLFWTFQTNSIPNQITCKKSAENFVVREPLTVILWTKTKTKKIKHSIEPEPYTISCHNWFICQRNCFTFTMLQTSKNVVLGHCFLWFVWYYIYVFFLHLTIIYDSMKLP